MLYTNHRRAFVPSGTHQIEHLRRLVARLVRKLRLPRIIATASSYTDISSSGNTWYGVAVEASPVIAGLQSEALHLLRLDETQCLNYRDQQFITPHITTGMIVGVGSPISFPELENKAYTCDVRVGVSGEHFIVSELLSEHS